MAQMDGMFPFHLSGTTRIDHRGIDTATREIQPLSDLLRAEVLSRVLTEEAADAIRGGHLVISVIWMPYSASTIFFLSRYMGVLKPFASSKIATPDLS